MQKAACFRYSCGRWSPDKGKCGQGGRRSGNSCSSSGYEITRSLSAQFDARVIVSMGHRPVLLVVTTVLVRRKQTSSSVLRCTIRYDTIHYSIFTCSQKLTNSQLNLPYGTKQTRMCANAQPDGRPAEHRWRPLFNAAKFG